MKKIGFVEPVGINLLQLAFDECRNYIGQNIYDASINKKETFWINLYQSGALAEDFKLPLNSIEALNTWLQNFVATIFNNTLKIIRYQFLINPVGSRAQRWHIDYSVDYSTVFIPLVRLNLLNSPQYIVLPNSVKNTIFEQIKESPDDINFDALASQYDFLTVSQLVCQAWSILYMKSGTIHRGIANLSTENRIMFAIELKPADNNTVSLKQELISTEWNGGAKSDHEH